MQAPSIVSSGRPRIGSGTSGIVAAGEEADDRGDVVGDAVGPVAVGADRLGAELGREDEGAGVDVGDRDQVEVQGGDDRVVAAAAAQRPEEVGLVLGVDGHRLAVGGDQLDRPDAVAGEAVAAPEPAEPAAERVAGDADVGRGARQRAEAVRLGRLAQLERRGRRPRPARSAPRRSTSIPRMRSVLIRIVSSSEPERDGPVAGPLAGDA